MGSVMCGMKRCDAVDRRGGGLFGRHHARMARVFFAGHLRRFTDAPEVDTLARRLRAALQDAFVVNPRLRGPCVRRPVADAVVTAVGAPARLWRLQHLSGETLG